MPDRAGSGSSGFRLFLQSLPDAIELARERGQPVTCPDPGSEHGRALLRTLRVEISEPDVTAPASTELRQDIELFWCPRCREETTTNDKTGLCLWCDGPVQPLCERRPALTAVATETKTCKTPGCEEPIVDERGPLAGLCTTHREEKKQARATAGASNGKASPAYAPRYQQRIRQLLEPAKALDRAAAKLATVPDDPDPRKLLAEAIAAVQRNDTPENLDRLASASRAAKKSNGGGSRRAKAQADHDRAERELKNAVAAFARELVSA